MTSDPAMRAETAAENANEHAARAQAAASTATEAEAAAAGHLDSAQQATARAQDAVGRAQAAAAQVTAGDQPSWIYGMVVGFLGIALLVLIAAIVIASLTGSRTISTDVVSAATLILGGLIGILAPTPKQSADPNPNR